MQTTLRQLRRFKILDNLGPRFCYTLYDAVDENDGKKVFLKVLDNSLAKNSKIVDNFSTSARIVSRLDHAGIVKLYGYGNEQDLHFIMSDRVEEPSLDSILKEHTRLSLPEALDLCLKVAHILRHAHLHGVIHGLLNPGCIFLTSDRAVKIDDFAFYWMAPFLSNMEFFKLVHYLAPEVHGNLKEVDGRADIYSLAVIMYQLLSGQPPTADKGFPTIEYFNGKDSKKKVKSSTSSKLESLVTRCLHENPDKRYWNFKDFIQDLKKIRLAI